MKKLRCSSLLLCLALILTACGMGSVKIDTDGWRYYRFEEIGAAVMLPGDMTPERTDAQSVSARGGELRLDVTACGELYADLESMAAHIAESTEQETGIVTINGVELVRIAPAGDDPTAVYYALGPSGDACRILLAPEEKEDDRPRDVRRRAAMLAIILESVCAGADAPDDAAVVPSAAASRPAVDHLVLVNKRNALPAGWEDTADLVRTPDVRGGMAEIERSACEAYFRLRRALEAEDVFIGLDSACRSAAEQRELAERFAGQYGQDWAETHVAAPGCSEHQTGLALDLCLRVDGEFIRGQEDPAQYGALWEKVHARLAEYGFILRYPEGGAYNTGCGYEPWHIRYVGAAAAKEIAAQGITLEEYLGADPAAVDYLVLVNGQHALPDRWEDEVEIVHMTNRHGEDIGVERRTYEAYCALKDDLAEDGVHLDINSAYRSVASQEDLVASFTKKYGRAYVEQFVAVPGRSEHHTGLALDLYLESEAVWAKIHAKLAAHGFILRYPEGGESITGYGYEPWHVRYVGGDTAREIASRGITLEEYLNAA